MPSLANLGLKKETIAKDLVDTADLPEQMGSRPRMLQPGPYVFRLPLLAALRECWDTIAPAVGTRVVAIFQDDAALTIVQAPDKDLNGTTHGNRVTNAERARGKADDPKTKKVADMDYLLAALGEKTLPKTNEGYILALQKHPGKTFGADVELGWYCNKDKPIRVPENEDGTGQLIKLDGSGEGDEKQALQNGCGSRFYQRDQAVIEAKDADGNFPNRITCTCGAVLYANENLVRFRATQAQAQPAAAAPAEG